MGLVRVFDDNFQQHGLHAAQVLLTHDDLNDRQRYLNARSTLLTLLKFGVVPVINENDTVATGNPVWRQRHLGCFSGKPG